MKFGGTSVKDKNAIERVISIVRGRMADKPLVVVSALAKVTRVLCGIAEEAEHSILKKWMSFWIRFVTGIRHLQWNCFPAIRRF